MKIQVVYATPQRQAVIAVELADGGTVQQAIERSGVLARFPEIDLTQQKVGIFGKVTALDATVEEGARIEIYRPITADPKTVKRRPKEGAAGQ